MSLLGNPKGLARSRRELEHCGLDYIYHRGAAQLRLAAADKLTLLCAAACCCRCSSLRWAWGVLVLLCCCMRAYV
jgi:hypothetical protein